MTNLHTCDNCRTGRLKQIRSTYANWHSGHFIIVPSVPAWQCDVCAAVEFDAEALPRLLTLLGPVTRPIAAHARSSFQRSATGFDVFSTTRKYQ